MELRCDNTAAIILATGEGSWRTKSAANKVYWVKERVDSGRLKVIYVNTLDQCADSLTKFLKGGQDQKRASAHLSLIELRNWTTRKGPKPRADGVHSVQKRPEVFGPRVSQAFCLEPVFSGSNVSTDFGLGSLVRRKKVPLSRRKKFISCDMFKNGFHFPGAILAYTRSELMR